MTVRYTPSQLRDAVAISQETYRHWKKVLPPLRRGAGHGPRFTVGDILATTVVRVLTVDFAIRVGAVSVVAHALFETCNTPWPVLERGRLIINLAAGDLQLASDTESAHFQAPVIVVPLQSAISRLHAALLAQPDCGSQECLALSRARSITIPGSGIVEVQA